MQKNDLTVFCGWRHPEPFSDVNYTYAVNGYSVIRVPKIECVILTNDVTKKIEQLIENYHTNTLEPFPKINGINGKKCRSCNGTGKIVEIECYECSGVGEVGWFNGFHDYEADCKGCDGTGRAKTPSQDGEHCEECNGTGIKKIQTPIRIGGFRFDSNLLYHFSVLPNAMIGITRHKTHGDAAVAYLEFDGGVGLVMGMSE